jgi:TRAP-type transport system periplasmic protein
VNKWLKRVSPGFIASGLLLAIGAGHAQDIKERQLKMAFQTDRGTAQYDGMEKFSELVKQKSGGKVTVKLFGGGALGKDVAVVSSMQGGTVDMALMKRACSTGW